jgi:signal transduction histidine kinase
VIVDDDEAAACALARMLSALGYTVVAAAQDPAAGLAMVRATRPDLAVIDLDVRGERSGTEVASELVAEDVPVVLISDADDPDIALRGRGAWGVVARPVTRTALRAAAELVHLQHEAHTRLFELERYYHALFDQERERAISASRESEARERMAVEASRAKTEFLAHMSHELRTPLNAVLGLSEAMLERIFGELDPAQVDALTTIHASGSHLLALINDVLDVARVESGKLPIETEQVWLRPLIDETTALVASQLASKRQRLVLDLAAALPPVDIDRRRIKQVLLNLLGNASKFSPPGATVTVRADGRDDARRVEIAVSDDGPGIAAAERARIFEPFVTLDPSMSRAHGGAGLGLTLARHIVDLHGGQIRVDSEPGRGATFTIVLPVSASYVGEASPLAETIGRLMEER